MITDHCVKYQISLSDGPLGLSMVRAVKTSFNSTRGNDHAGVKNNNGRRFAFLYKKDHLALKNMIFVTSVRKIERKIGIGEHNLTLLRQ